MRYTELSRHIHAALASVGYIRTIHTGDVYELWNNRTVRYPAACSDLISVQQQGDLKQYSIIIHCADKLFDDHSNETHALDYAEAAIDIAINRLRETPGIANVQATTPYTPFSQKFADTLAGHWVQLSVLVTPDVSPCD